MDEEESKAFYASTAWRRKRKEILKRDRYECQECKKRGRYSKAVIVHHIEHLREHEDKALENENLESVCRQCHETVCHPERLPKEQKQSDKFTNQEKW